MWTKWSLLTLTRPEWRPVPKKVPPNLPWQLQNSWFICQRIARNINTFCTIFLGIDLNFLFTGSSLCDSIVLVQASSVFYILVLWSKDSWDDREFSDDEKLWICSVLLATFFWEKWLLKDGLRCKLFSDSSISLEVDELSMDKFTGPSLKIKLDGPFLIIFPLLRTKINIAEPDPKNSSCQKVSTTSCQKITFTFSWLSTTFWTKYNMLNAYIFN